VGRPAAPPVEIMRYLVTNPKEGMEGGHIVTKFHSDEPLLDIQVGETKEVSERAAKWLAYTYNFVAISEIPDAPKVELKVEKESKVEKEEKRHKDIKNKEVVKRKK